MMLFFPFSYFYPFAPTIIFLNFESQRPNILLQQHSEILEIKFRVHG